MISIIVPTVDRHDALERFLSSADAQLVDDYEVLIIDQGDGAIEPLAGRHRNVQPVQVHCCAAGVLDRGVAPQMVGVTMGVQDEVALVQPQTERMQRRLQ